jgi:hypothetical protein
MHEGSRRGGPEYGDCERFDSLPGHKGKRNSAVPPHQGNPDAAPFPIVHLFALWAAPPRPAAPKGSIKATRTRRRRPRHAGRGDNLLHRRKLRPKPIQGMYSVPGQNPCGAGNAGSNLKMVLEKEYRSTKTPETIPSVKLRAMALWLGPRQNKIF